MKNKAVFIIALIAILFNPVAGLLIRDKIIKVAEFPDNEMFLNPEFGYIDAGLRYKQLEFCHIPLFNYEIEWCGYSEDLISKNEYVIMTRNELAEAAGTINLTLPTNPELPFWDSIGGKIVVIGILCFIFISRALNNKNRKEAPIENS